MITHGIIDVEGFKQIFQNIADATQTLLDCKVLVNLQDSTCNVEAAAICAFVDNLKAESWSPTNRVALVSVPDPYHYRELCTLSAFLSNRAIESAVFRNTMDAVSWLVK